MTTQDSTRFPVYVFEVPVRLWHWTMALCLVVLAISGYLIGSPLGTASGEASDHYSFGYIRFAHFAAAYIFAILFAMRVLWAFIGNRFARELFATPVGVFDATWRHGFVGQVKRYLFLDDGSHQAPQGHNPLAQAGMFFMYVLGTVFMICTGFAMYGEGLGQDSWAFMAFSSWVLPLVGDSQNAHTFHHLGMWYLILFTIIHLYMVIREDLMTEVTVISTMLNGWRVLKK